MSCVSTMKECYDTQSGALKSFDDTTAQASGALAARAAKDMCVDKVAACAALYAKEGDEECKVDKKTGKITNGDACGLASLRNFVDNVDDVRIAEGCDAAVKKYLEDLCTPTSGDEGYPWNCRLKEFGRVMVSGGNLWTGGLVGNPTTIEQLVVNYTYGNCVIGNNYSSLEEIVKRKVEQELDGLMSSLDVVLSAKCLEMEGVWQSVYGNRLSASAPKLTRFYSNVFGGRTDNSSMSIGTCFENTTMTACLSYNIEGRDPVAIYNADRDECSFTNQWYEQQCAALGDAYFENDVCYY